MNQVLYYRVIILKRRNKEEFSWEISTGCLNFRKDGYENIQSKGDFWFKIWLNHRTWPHIFLGQMSHRTDSKWVDWRQDTVFKKQ